LKERIGMRFPELFKEFFCRYHTLDLDLAFLRLAPSPSNDPLGPLAAESFEYPEETARQIHGLSLLPFGSEAFMDAGPICFDLRGEVDCDDPPVCYWDHDFDGTERQIGPRIFSSFSKLLECAIRKFRHGPRAKTIDEFIAIDPKGAGGTGREYWTSARGTRFRTARKLEHRVS
jgi:hypothetical protein